MEFNMKKALIILFLLSLSVQVAVAAKPAAPSGLVARPASGSIIDLSWVDESDNEDRYELLRSEDGKNWETVVDDLAPDTESYTDSGLESAKEYHYRLNAWNADGGTPSNLAIAVTDTGPGGIRTMRYQDGINGYSGTQSLGIIQTQPDRSNLSSRVWVDNNDHNDQSQVLVNFRDTIGSGVDQIRPGTQIEKAILRIYLGTDSNVQTRFPVQFNQMLVDWDESHSWNSSVWNGDGVQADGEEAKEDYDTIRAFLDPGKYYEVDVTPTVESWLNGDPEYGWLIHSDFSDGYAFYTHHTSNVEERPELIVQFDTEPENDPPEMGTLHAPSDNAVGVTEPANLEFDVSDPNGDSLEVNIQGRKAPHVEKDFSVIVLPDTQFYTGDMRGGKPDMFHAQTDWIVENHEEHNIAFVLHVGDIVQSGDQKGGSKNLKEWNIARQAMHKLEDPETTGLEEGIPYGVNVGNHDQEPMWDPEGTTEYFNLFFGENHFEDKSYYGGHYGDNNDNYFMRFGIGSYKFLVISLEYRATPDPDILEWADSLIKDNPDHRVIVVSHHMVNPGQPAAWSPYGESIYEVLKDNANLDLMMGGHITGEGLRTDTYDGNTTYSLVQDYQGYYGGGNGFFRIYTFSPKNNEINLSTYSPYVDETLDAFMGEISLPYDMGTDVEDFEELVSLNADSGTRVQYEWDNLEANSGYEWFATLSDGRKSTDSGVYSFQTGKRTYTSWRQEHFSDTAPNAAREDDPDEDGYTNFFEFVFEGDPHAEGKLYAPMPTLVIGNGTTLIEYERLKNTGFSWEYEVSEDLLNWTTPQTLGLSIEQSTEDNQDGTETVYLDVSNSSQPLFWRIVVEENN